MLEIERKFLLKRLPKVKPVDNIDIIQYYWKNPATNIWERFRYQKSKLTGDKKYIHCIKINKGPGINEETETDITKAEYKEAILKCTKTISKNRHIYIQDDIKWEVDKFKNIDVVVAEAEIPSMEYDLKIPRYIQNKMIMEVTEFKEFSNRSLARSV